MRKKNNIVPEIIIPKGYGIEDILEMDGDLWDEQPILEEEVKIRFE